MPIGIDIFVRIVVAVRIAIEAVNAVRIEAFGIHAHEAPDARIKVSRTEVAQMNATLQVLYFLAVEIERIIALAGAAGGAVNCSLAVGLVGLFPQQIARSISARLRAAGELVVEVGDGFAGRIAFCRNMLSYSPAL